MLGIPVPAEVDVPVYDVAVNKNISAMELQETEVLPKRYKYEFEKYINGLELEKMSNWEKELIRK
jgi:hypothetical protein